MAKTLLLKADVRENTGTHSSVNVRKQNRIPAIVYGHKKQPVAISLDTHNLTTGLHHGHRVFDVQIDKKKETMIVKAIQYDYLGKNIIHADLMRVDVTELIKVTVAIEPKGDAKGVQ